MFGLLNPMLLLIALTASLVEGSSVVARQHVAQAANASYDYDHLKQSVLRILTYRTKFHWSRPFNDQESSGSVGSGFLVSIDPPLIVTCAHVVEDADGVDIQVTEFGQTRFAAVVYTINNDNDVAILRLLEPEKVKAQLLEKGVHLKALTLAEQTPPLGHEVVAPGFPLGQATMKLSTGVVSGVDHVQFHYMNLALQSTAIISSGNSGSPLLSAENQEVIGMNYAKNPKEAQINYVVPLWKLRQVLAKHHEVHGEHSNLESLPYQMKRVTHGLVLTPGQDVFYMRANTGKVCTNGVLISEIYDESPFKDSRPPVQAESFLTSIDGVKLDRYGQGAKPGYVDELVDFDDLIWMRGGTGEQDIDFEACNAQTGEVSKHTMNMAWREERQGRGIQHIYEPRVEKVDWEIFGDLLFMDLNDNLIELMSGEFHNWALVRFLEPSQRRHDRLAVMIHEEGGDAEEALDLSNGYNLAIVETINGVPIKNLADLRANMIPAALMNSTHGVEMAKKPQGKVDRFMDKLDKLADESSGNFASQYKAVLDKDDYLWNLKTTVGTEFSALFLSTLKKQVSYAEAGYLYFMTPGSKAAAGTLGLLSPTAALLEERVAPPKMRSPKKVDPAKMYGEPLEVLRREGKNAIVDFVKGEEFQEW